MKHQNYNSPEGFGLTNIDDWGQVDPNKTPQQLAMEAPGKQPLSVGRLAVPVFIFITARMFLPYTDPIVSVALAAAITLAVELVWWGIRRSVRRRREKIALQNAIAFEAAREADFERRLAQAKRAGKLDRFGKTTDA